MLIGHNAIVSPFTLMVGYGALALPCYIPAEANAAKPEHRGQPTRPAQLDCNVERGRPPARRRGHRCLVGALRYIRTGHNLHGVPARYYLRRAMKPAEGERASAS